MQLTPRQMKILSIVTELYIQNLEPVSSKTVCDCLENSCSSATVRNEMSTLYEKGLIEQPHTSAGRVPSQAGYRLYVDCLMNRYRLSDADKNFIDSLLPKHVDSTDEFMNLAGKALAEVTDCASFSTTPADAEAKIKCIEIFPLTGRKYLLVLFTHSGMLKNRLCTSDEVWGKDLFEKFANALNACYKGKKLNEINPASAQAAAVQMGADMLPFASVLENFLSAVVEASRSRLMLDGQENLFVRSEFSPDSVQKMLNVIKKHDLLLSLLSDRSEQTSILFGNETGESELSPAGIVSSFYNVSGRRLGRIGIIGPARMDYVHIIPTIEYFADSLGAILEKSVNNDDWS